MRLALLIFAAAIERHLRNADCTVDSEKKKLEIAFARLLLVRLRYACAKIPAAEMAREHSEALDLLAQGLPEDAAKRVARVSRAWAHSHRAGARNPSSA